MATEQQQSDYLMRVRRKGRRLLLRSLPAGLLAGLVAVAFEVMLAAAEGIRQTAFEDARSLGGWGWLVTMAVCGLSVWGGIWLVQSLAPDAAGSGIPQIKAVLHHGRSMKAMRVLGVKFLGGLLAIGGGLALGREGPTVQMGAALGQQLSDVTDTHLEDRRIITSAGAGAGLAAAFNAPLAGMLFVIEELHGVFSPPLLFAVFIAAVTADVITRVVFGQVSVFHVVMQPTPPLTILPWAALLGVLTGVMGVVFNRILLMANQTMAALRRWPRGAGGLLVGALVGLVGWFLPQSLGSGTQLTEQVLNADISLKLALQYLGIRFALSMVSYGTGAAGGIFAPLLLFGALLGFCSAYLFQPWLPPGSPEHQQVGAAIIGMGACFTAIVRAPLTGIVIILEMTGGFQMMLPLMVACLISYSVAEALGEKPIYVALLQQQTSEIGKR